MEKVSKHKLHPTFVRSVLDDPGKDCHERLVRHFCLIQMPWMKPCGHDLDIAKQVSSTSADRVVLYYRNEFLNSLPMEINPRKSVKANEVPKVGKIGVKIAYLIIIHGSANRFFRLLERIHEPQHIYLVHIDKYTGSKLIKLVQNGVNSNPKYMKNVMIMKYRIGVHWGGASIIQMQMAGMYRLLQEKIYWDFFINLSESDYPIKTSKEIREFLSKHLDHSFLGFRSAPNKVQDLAKRTTRLYIECDNGVFTTSKMSFKNNHPKVNKRPLPNGLKVYRGDQWFILHRRLVEYMAISDRIFDLYEYFTSTYIPDESFIHSIALNSPYFRNVIPDTMRYIHMPKNELEMSDISEMKKSKALFARKFVDENVLLKIEEYLDDKVKQEQLEKHGGK